MKNDNIIDFVVYLGNKLDLEQQDTMLTEDLCLAIKILIERLRNHQTVKEVDEMV